VYCRHAYGKTFKNIEEAKQNTEIVLDLKEVPFVSNRMLLKTIVDKVKMNDDHSLIAFTLDIGGTERLTGGIKDMQKNEVLKNIKLEGISGMEFGRGRETLFYVETDSMNRPCKVKKLNLTSMEETTVFTDQDPTHYVEIGITKDGKYLLINSSTKEDSEVWVLDRDN
jgi:protease II